MQPRAAWVVDDLEMVEADWQAGSTAPETPTVVREIQTARLLSERFRDMHSASDDMDMSVLRQADEHRAAVYALTLPHADDQSACFPSYPRPYPNPNSTLTLTPTLS